MRSVVASHGPGSNPRGNATCNAILLQCFRFYRSSVFNILDRHSPPSWDVLPLNLAQKSQNFKIDQNGSDIEYRPDIFTGCPGQPELNPRKQISRHDIAGASPDGGGRHHENRARRKATHAAATSAALPCAIARRTAPTSAQRFAHGAAGHCPAIARSNKRSGATSGATSRDQRGRDAQPAARDQRRNIVQHSRKIAATSAGHCASSAWPLAHKRAGRGAAMRGEAVALFFFFRTPQNPLPMLNTLSSVSVRESRIQYLCDPQWFRDTTSLGPTTIAAPESQFRTCPSDHYSIGYPHMSASGESSTTMHRLLHASGSHPIPPPNDPKFCIKALGSALAHIWALARLVHQLPPECTSSRMFLFFSLAHMSVLKSLLVHRLFNIYVASVQFYPLDRKL
ncbi:hypothetical protein F511_26939 [Dorcoceras hygrometricum]|uniref:Uncharacterized protein n=1 Tax=Dorcoceras hygrometricum TaxID=472368 RepID=A0A2Z7ARJ0_9LAMI|nr:hypothetical protein F511_26939 [Dorcoceras hygrometricum]